MNKEEQSEGVLSEIQNIIGVTNIDYIVYDNYQGEEEWGLSYESSQQLGELIIKIDKEYRKLDTEYKKEINSYDGYLLGMGENKYVRLLKEGNIYNGMVYYDVDKVVRLLIEKYGHQYQCNMYELGVIRGKELGT